MRWQATYRIVPVKSLHFSFDLNCHSYLAFTRFLFFLMFLIFFLKRKKDLKNICLAHFDSHLKCCRTNLRLWLYCTLMNWPEIWILVLTSSRDLSDLSDLSDLLTSSHDLCGLLVLVWLSDESLAAANGQGPSSPRSLKFFFTFFLLFTF